MGKQKKKVKKADKQIGQNRKRACVSQDIDDQEEYRIPHKRANITADIVTKELAENTSSSEYSSSDEDDSCQQDSSLNVTKTKTQLTGNLSHRKGKLKSTGSFWLKNKTSESVLSSSEDDDNSDSSDDSESDTDENESNVNECKNNKNADVQRMNTRNVLDADKRLTKNNNKEHFHEENITDHKTSEGDIDDDDDDDDLKDGDSDSDEKDDSDDAEESGNESDNAEAAEEVDEMAAVKKELASMPLEDLMKIKNKLGLKLFNKIMHGDKIEGKKKKDFKRENKNRPMEMSSKKRVPILRQAAVAKEKVRRDPRFDDLSGTFEDKHFSKNYSFLSEVKNKEKQLIQKKLKKTKDETKQQALKRLLNKMTQQEQLEEERRRKQELEQQWKEKERQMVKEGKTPYFLKKSEKKKMYLEDKFEKLQKSGKFDKYMTKKLKKTAQKDRKNMPFRRPTFV